VSEDGLQAAAGATGSHAGSRWARVGVAVAASSVLFVFAYAVLRVTAAIWWPDPNPVIVIWSAHAGYFWRLWIAVYLSGMAFLGLCFAPASVLGVVARALPRAVWIATAAIALQGVLLP
jgi:hypothetical protein